MEAHDHGRLHKVERIRGRTCYPAPAQAAECFLRRETEYRGLEELTLLGCEARGDRRKREGRIRSGEAVLIVRHVWRSLIEANERGVIHRDLKPDNLILTRGSDTGSQVCKVLDFGIAKLMGRERGVDALETQAGTVFGTPRYMSPEQAQGRQLDARSDLYSLGVILFHMLGGRPPYTDNDAVVVMAHHIKTMPKRPSTLCPECAVPAGLAELVMRLLPNDPQHRPHSAAHVLPENDAPGLDEAADGGGSGEVVCVHPGAARTMRRRGAGGRQILFMDPSSLLHRRRVNRRSCPGPRMLR